MKKFVMVVAVIVAAIAILSGCGFSFGSESGRSGSYTKNGKASDDITVDGKGLSKLIVSNGVGTIDINDAAGDKVEIHYKETIRGIGSKIDEILEQTLVKARVEGETLVVNVRTRDNENEDFWSWLSDHYMGTNVTIDFDIKVPDNLSEFAVADGVGDISLDGVKGKCTVTSGVGDIKLENISLTGDCALTAGTGDISVSTDIAELSGLSIKSGVGKTSLRLPGDSKFSIDATTGVGSIDGNLVQDAKGFVGETLKQDVNGGGARIEIKSGTGDIRINKK